MLSIEFMDGASNFDWQGFENEVLEPVHDKSYSSSSYSLSVNALSDVRYERYDIGEVLRELTDSWMNETLFSSSMADIVGNEYYLKVIDIGKPALSFIFEDLRSSPKHWFVALRLITGEDPVGADAAGNFDSMVAAWLSWGESQGY